MLQNRWIEIDTDKVKHNIGQVQKLVDERVRLIVVIKKDAYGHGAGEVARIAYHLGIDFFAVSFLEEAIELRNAGINASIMIFTPLISEDEFTTAIKNNITITISSWGEWEIVKRQSLRLRKKAIIHLKAETGLGRFGFEMEELINIAAESKENLDYIYIEGIYTHMAQAASNAGYTEKQFHKFIEICMTIEENGLNIPVKHCANSAVTLKYPHMHMNAVRIGTLVSGQYPAGKFNSSLSLFDPFQYKCRIVAVKSTKKGSRLGYYSTYKLRKDAQIAVIPVGYSDGLGLEVGNPAAGLWDLIKITVKSFLKYMGITKYGLHVSIAGRQYPIRGKVFMQMALLELPIDAIVPVGTEVVLPIKKTLIRSDVVKLYLSKGEAGKKFGKSGITYLLEGE